MIDLLPLLKDLIRAPGISGYEGGIRPIIEKAWTPLVNEISTSRLGSLHALQRGTGSEPRPTILVAAHMDAIGLMVSAIVDGFLRLTSVGGIDARVLPGQMVRVHGRTDLPGMVVPTPTRLLPSSVRPGVVPLEYMLIDTGLPPDEVASIVRVGDPVSFAQEPLETSGDTLVGHTLDNRAGVAALTLCLDILHSRSHAWDVWAVATVQEETNYGGALTSAFQLHPALGVTIDVTFGSEQSSPGYLTFPLGKGPTLGWGPVVHPYLFKTMKQLAERLEIPLATETAPRYSGTDSDVMVMAAEGIPNMVIGIPLRYMHTPVEMVALKDISRAGRLVAEFIAELDKNFMDKLTWED